MYIYVWILNLRSSEPRNPEASTFRISEVGYIRGLGHLNSRSSEPRNPEMRVPLSCLFRNSEVVVCWMLTFETPKNLNPEIPKC
jgi:hypothetical protein